MKNTGKEYEQFVASIQQALLNAENITTQKNIIVEVDKKITDNCGIERQFDIYWEYEMGGFTYKTVIECKDYASKISIEKIDALIGKTRDLPGLKPVFATKMGYQAGARIKAEQNKIDLLIVREQNDSDWMGEDGTPYVKKIAITQHILMPAYIKSFEPLIDAHWVKENTDIDISKPINFAGLNNEIFIEDNFTNEKYSLFDLSRKLSPKDDKQHGEFEIVEEFENAFIFHQEANLRLKLKGYKIEYSISEPVISSMEFDLSKELIGVIEYLEKGTKKSIFKNGIVR